MGERIEVNIVKNDMVVYQNQVNDGKAIADVRIGKQMMYINYSYRVGRAINKGSVDKVDKVGIGSNWNIEIKRLGD